MLRVGLFPECTCNFLGTERSQCLSRDDCLCQRATGQCQCLPNVIGLTCDHCAPNYWNLASGHGCEFCNCDPNNAYTSGCNEVPVSPHLLSEQLIIKCITRCCYVEISQCFRSVWFWNTFTTQHSFEHAVFHSSQDNVNVVMASVERPAGIARRTSGVIPESSAEVYFVH